jgi:hypothetical protein
LAKADALLANVEAEQMRNLDRLAVNTAETSARRGEIAMTRLRYAEAATHFANAAAVFPPQTAHRDERIGYLQSEARALCQQGDEYGDNGALLLAIERYKALLVVNPRERVPLKWAATQDNLGIALRKLGDRETGTARLSVKHIRAMSMSCTRDLGLSAGRPEGEWGTLEFRERTPEGPKRGCQLFLEFGRGCWPDLNVC